MPMVYFGKEFGFVQPDGKKVILKCWGNQNSAVFEDPEGYTVIENPVSGFYEYARLSGDKSTLESTGVKVGSENPGTLGLEKHLRATKKITRTKARAASIPQGPKTRWQERREQSRDVRSAAMKGRGPEGAPPSDETKGNFVGLCILIQFPDDKGTISQSEVEQFCNTKGYTGYGNNGSVFDYFYDNSGGRLKYTNIIAPYYTAKKSKAYYSDPGIEYGKRAVELIREALANLKSSGFDFSRLSVDDGGYIYALNAFYAGDCDNGWYKGLWPHSSGLIPSFNAGDGRKIRDYQITNMGDELTLATYCHENGHMICSFPDLYDYPLDGRTSNGVGTFCLMCSPGDDDKNPVQICAYLKNAAGWADKATLLSGGTYTVRAGINDFLIHRKNPDEYFIIENRFRDKRDHSLPGSGLAIFHVDKKGSMENPDMTPESHYECSLEQADGQFDLEREKNGGEAEDLFTAPHIFGKATVPDSKWWDGTESGLEITGIGKPGREMSITVGKAVASKGITLKESPKIRIPDNDPAGITRTLKTVESGVIKGLEVSVTIQHSKIGNLVVTLISPRGTEVTLHRQTGGGQDNIKQTYTVDSVPDLANLTGEPVQGTWSLKVADLAKKNIGKLNSWELKIIPL